MNEVRIELAEWSVDQAALIALRTEVFVHEQQVPVELEIDGIDPACIHVKAVDSNSTIIGTARLLASGYIGRMCVRKAFRRQGVGAAMLSFLIDYAHSREQTQLLLNAQLSAQPFYQRCGFHAQGEVFLEAGIQHQLMTLDLK